MPGIVTLTLNPTVDLTLEVCSLVDEGKNRAVLSNVQAGGGGINVARCLRELGYPVTAAHTGGTETGDWLNRLLDEEGIDHIGVRIASATRIALVLSDGAGHSFHIVPSGPTLTDAEGVRCLDAVREAVRPGGFLVMTGSQPAGLSDDFSAEVIRCAAKRGVRVVHDIAGAPLRKALGERAFVARLDRREASALIGRKVLDFVDAHQAAQQVIDFGGADIAIATVGPLGAVCVTKDRAVRIAAPPLPSMPLSDACAGDSLIAAVTARLANGDDPVTACEYGVAAATATVLRPATEVFRRADLEQLCLGIRTTTIA